MDSFQEHISKLSPPMPERTGSYGVGMYGIGARWVIAQHRLWQPHDFKVDTERGSDFRFFSTYMFFMHGGAGYTRFIQNIGMAFYGWCLLLFFFWFFNFLENHYRSRSMVFPFAFDCFYLRFITMQCNHAITASTVSEGYIVFDYYFPRAATSRID